MPTQGALFSPRGAEPEEYGRATSQDLDPGSYAHEGSDGENCFTGDQPDDDSFGYQESDWVMPTQAPEDEHFVYGDHPQAQASQWQPDEQPAEEEEPGTAAAEEAIMAEVAEMDSTTEAQLMQEATHATEVLEEAEAPGQEQASAGVQRRRQRRIASHASSVLAAPSAAPAHGQPGPCPRFSPRY